MKKIFLIAGDPSGDIHASNLARALKKKDPELLIEAAGGEELKKASDRFHLDLVSGSVIGFWEPIKKLGMFKEMLDNITKLFSDSPPDMVVPVDFFGFNSFVIKRAKQMNIPVYYFISPQVWASREGRVKTLKKYVDKMLVIFPFEEDLYRCHNVPVSFVGHPLLEVIPEAQPVRVTKRIKIGLLPGSRISEVTRHLPIMLEAADLVHAVYRDLEVDIFALRNIDRSIYEKIIAGNKSGSYASNIVYDQNYAIRKDLTLAITSSGTATLENAMLGIPMVVIYKTSWITYILARLLIRIDNIAMANILYGKKLVPELTQHNATGKSIARLVNGWIKDPEALESISKELLKIRDKLGAYKCTDRAAAEIIGFLGERR